MESGESGEPGDYRDSRDSGDSGDFRNPGIPEIQGILGIQGDLWIQLNREFWAFRGSNMSVELRSNLLSLLMAILD